MSPCSSLIHHLAVSRAQIKITTLLSPPRDRRGDGYGYGYGYGGSGSGSGSCGGGGGGNGDRTARREVTGARTHSPADEWAPSSPEYSSRGLTLHGTLTVFTLWQLYKPLGRFTRARATLLAESFSSSPSYILLRLYVYGAEGGERECKDVPFDTNCAHRLNTTDAAQRGAKLRDYRRGWRVAPSFRSIGAKRGKISNVKHGARTIRTVLYTYKCVYSRYIWLVLHAIHKFRKMSLCV